MNKMKIKGARLEKAKKATTREKKKKKTEITKKWGKKMHKI